VSWSAIAQIESGRRQDVHLSSLSALADALGVSVDYLVGSQATIAPRLFEHRALTYRSDEEYVAGVVPFLAAGIEQSHCLLVVTTAPKMALLREALGESGEQVEFTEWADWYHSPLEALSRYRAFVQDRFAAGAIWIRIVADAGWSGRSPAETAAWTRYESLVNLVFAPSPATFVCTYDTRSFPVEVVAEAACTHPYLLQGSDAAASMAYREPGAFLLDA
jgi:transcriptional regulator with XRE-family HTH domain